MDSLIQWPKAMYWDRPFNTWLGCRPISPACDNCYARTSTENRFSQSFEPHRTKKVSPPNKGVVFCGNMTDMFGDWVSTHESAEFIKCCAMKSNADAFLWCTKRVVRMCWALETLADKKDALSTSYFGFTAENQRWYETRMSEINECFPPWANLWISAEPLLGPIDLRWNDVCIKPKVVITGCESGPNRRPCKLEWIESIVEQCRSANVPVFVKQVCLRNNKFTRDINEFPENIRIRQVPWVKD